MQQQGKNLLLGKDQPPPSKHSSRLNEVVTSGRWNSLRASDSSHLKTSAVFFTFEESVRISDVQVKGASAEMLYALAPFHRYMLDDFKTNRRSGLWRYLLETASLVPRRVPYQISPSDLSLFWKAFVASATGTSSETIQKRELISKAMYLAAVSTSDLGSDEKLRGKVVAQWLRDEVLPTLQRPDTKLADLPRLSAVISALNWGLADDDSVSLTLDALLELPRLTDAGLCQLVLAPLLLRFLPRSCFGKMVKLFGKMERGGLTGGSVSYYKSSICLLAICERQARPEYALDVADVALCLARIPSSVAVRFASQCEWICSYLMENSDVTTAEATARTVLFSSIVDFLHSQKSIEPAFAKCFRDQVCTFSVTRRSHVKQYYYRCTTCWPGSTNKGCCRICAVTCHAGHVLGLQFVLGTFFCDCSIEPRPIGNCLHL